MTAMPGPEPAPAESLHLLTVAEYADAGIGYYWIADIDDPISITSCHLTEEFGNLDDQSATGTFRTRSPFPVEINLDRLR